MHLLVTNITKWARSAVDEVKHLGHANHHEALKRARAEATHEDSWEGQGHNEMSVDEHVFGEYSAIVGAFNTEFLIATAAVMLIVWLNTNELIPHDEEWRAAVEGRSRRKMAIKLTLGPHFPWGLFLGAMLSIYLSIGVLIHAYYREDGSQKALWAMESTSTGAYTAMVAACIVGLVEMRRSLDGKWDMNVRGRKDELLDNVLMLVGVAAEVVYCAVGATGVIVAAEFHHKISSTIRFLLRAAQVLLQAHLIMDLNGVESQPDTCPVDGRMPGRQAVLFLLWANLSLFVYYCVQTVSSVFAAMVVGHLPHPYNWIIALALPFVLFYRFHSSAVFVGIYKRHCICKAGGVGESARASGESATLSIGDVAAGRRGRKA